MLIWSLEAHGSLQQYTRGVKVLRASWCANPYSSRQGRSAFVSVAPRTQAKKIEEEPSDHARVDRPVMDSRVAKAA